MKIRILALVSMLAIGASVAAAQAPAKDKDKGSEVKKDKKWEKNEAKKGDHDEHHDGDRADRYKWGSQRRLFGGIQLTDTQKSSIKAIHAKYEPQQKAIRDTLKINHKADMKPSASDPLRARAQTLATQERAEIRAVLTAEQQVRFDQNVAKFDERRDGRGKRGDRGNG